MVVEDAWNPEFLRESYAVEDTLRSALRRSPSRGRRRSSADTVNGAQAAQFPCDGSANQGGIAEG